MSNSGGIGGLFSGLFGGQGGFGKVIADLFGMPDPPPAAGTNSPRQPHPQGQPGGSAQPAAGASAVSTKPAPAGSQTPTNGGLPSVLDSLRGAGLGDQVDSWVGTGPNKPIKAGQVTQALGEQRIHDLAAKAGVSDRQVADGLAKALPEVVNEVTPQGQVPDTASVQGHLQRLLDQ